MKSIITLSVVLLLLTGCSLHKFDPGDPHIGLEQSKESSRAACYQAQARGVINTDGLSELGKVMLLQQQSYERLVGALTGKNFDPCGSGTNLNDVLIADSNNRNRSLQSLGGGVLNLGKWLAGAWAATEIVDSIGKNAGNTSSVDTGGGDSSISNSRTSTETVTDQTATNVGEEGTATTGGVPAEPVGVLPVDDIPVDDIPLEPITPLE